MNTLTKKLMNFIESDSIGYNNVHYDTFKKDTEVDTSCDDSISVYNGNLDMIGEIYKFTPENFIKRLTWRKEYCSQICRRKVGKKYKDFTTEDCLKFLDYWSNRKMINYIECSPFGTGSDVQWNWKTITINGVEYFMYYGRD